MRTVLCHGCFDLIHYGHLKYLQEAKKYGERLIVSITGDRFVNKGPGRPYFDENRRAEMLRNIRFIDEVFICDEPTAMSAIKKYKPDFYVKGSDYRNFDQDVTGEIINEKKEVEKYGGKVIFTEEETFSSSKLIKTFGNTFNEDQKHQIEIVNSCGGIDEIIRIIGECRKLRVLVIGEPIIDVYRFVRPEGISSKSPSISARFEKEERYQGGTLAIANHLKSFCHVDLCHWDIGKEPKKIRYISGNQRIFEVTHIYEDRWPKIEIDTNYDLFILADFGHGMFEGEFLDQCANIPKEKFVGLNVQTNSSNFGFNTYTKHDRFDYLCLDTREARLAEHDRSSNPITVAHSIKNKINRVMSMTTGPEGAYLFYGAQTYHSPAFSDSIVDATGAGDAYFALTSLLLANNCTPELVPFIGNIFAGLKTKIIGNKEAVSKASLLKAAKSILA